MDAQGVMQNAEHPHPEVNGDSGEVAMQDAVGTSEPLRPVFLGNLTMAYKADEVIDIFQRPIHPNGAPEGSFHPVYVDRIDVKRGYCFVFLKDVQTIPEKELAERFISDINGMAVPNVSTGLRAEFARGDGRIKKKEDERRKDIRPSETLFVVNFHEETTKKEDLQMLFQPHGELVRIDMKGNYAFVQFRTVEEAIRAKDATNGGKLDRSVLTVEYVARQRGEGRRDRFRGSGGIAGGANDRDRRFDDRRGGGHPPRGPPMPPPDRHSDRRDMGYDRRDRLDRRDDRYDDIRYRGRERSPPGVGGVGGGGGGYRGRRSRSRSPISPPRYRSRSPPRSRHEDRDRVRYDDYRDGGGRRSPGMYRERERSPERGPERGPERDFYRGVDRDRGYRP